MQFFQADDSLRLLPEPSLSGYEFLAKPMVRNEEAVGIGVEIGLTGNSIEGRC
jgi:hypothetical protein